MTPPPKLLNAAQQKANMERYHSDPKYRAKQDRIAREVMEGITGGLQAQLNPKRPAKENTGVGLWHIGHVVPPEMFDLTKAEQRKMCFHFTNLRPEWNHSRS